MPRKSTTNHEGKTYPQSTTTFGKTLHHYREKELQITQTKLAKAISEHPVIKLTATDISEIEQDRRNDLVKQDGVFDVLAHALEEAAEIQKWDKKKIQAMYSALKEAFNAIDANPGTPLSATAFGLLLVTYREQLGLTQEQFADAILDREVLLVKEDRAADSPVPINMEYVAHIEGGGRPSYRYVIAATDTIASKLAEQKKPHHLSRQNKNDFFSAGTHAMRHYTLSRNDAPMDTKTAKRSLFYELIPLIFGEEASTKSLMDLAVIMDINQPSMSKKANDAGQIHEEEKEMLIAAFEENRAGSPTYFSQRDRLREIVDYLSTNTNRPPNFTVYTYDTMEKIYEMRFQKLRGRDSSE